MFVVVGGGGVVSPNPTLVCGGSPSFKSSTLPLPGFVLGSPEINFLTTSCIANWSVSTSSDF